ncbi:ABC transporter substrate-binding protein [Lachnotalea sp. AF33-28]|jgi:multiple sugar transport system substrate-binding protein|uniref:ABC transporter substrate-binding protein n=1 Tax=Lachnotalea sp. AF33-28 TaxID=2292046 RepID=UPI000E4A431A|nr:sugar ABC transporter substrate-binding protein [Lachnotalea sp. AF33-28]RHP29074.1 sugar ABC transporter substrate-binding protein [Lachnotalea sp. AF33-28]
MKRKRLTAILSSILLVVMLVSGCSETKNAPTQDGSTVSQPQGKVELKAWMRGSGNESTATIVTDEFNEKQSDIKVNYEVYGDNYTDVVKLAFASNEMPDYFSVATIGDLKQYVDAGYLAPLDDYISDEFREKINPSALAQYTYDGKVYGIADSARFIRLYYNRDLFEKSGLDPNQPPKTLEEMLTFAKQITEAGKGEYFGFGLPIKSGSTWERNIDNIAILSGLTGPWAFDYTTGRFDFAKQTPIIEYFHELYASGSIMPGSESMDIEMVRANFATDKIAMYFDGNWMINGYNNEIEAAKNLNYDTALVPIFDGQKRAKDYLTMDSGLAVSINSKHIAEAVKAIEYTTLNLYDASMNKYPDRIAPAFSLVEEVNVRINSMDEVKSTKGMSGIKDMENLSSFPVVPSQKITLEGDSREVVYPILVIEGKDIEKELQKLSDSYNAALDKAIEQGVLDESDLKPEGFDYYTR